MTATELPFRHLPFEGFRQIRPRVFTDQHAINRLECEFLAVSLDGLPCQYSAISNLWRSPTKTGKVWCSNNQYLSATSSALSVLRAVAATNFSGYIWIDALCVGQNNAVEGASQIRLMRDVYAAAHRLIPNNSEAMDFVITLCRAISNLYREQQPVNLQTLAQSQGCKYPSTYWTALS